ncbi:Monocarboxylate transporter 5 [Lamellibrachia satsuma]|nr:Monocarboxylate transporter 5 [Lamellibrachia satsuma]
MGVTDTDRRKESCNMHENIDKLSGAPIDKGWAWMCLLGIVMVNFLVVGCCIRSFGIFFELLQERYRTSAVEIAWIPAIVGSVGLFSAIPANLVCNKFGQRRVVVVGGVLMNMGFVLSTFAKKLCMLYLTYGILIGLGIGLSYVPSLVIIGSYFEKKRALANGMAFAAGSAGTFVSPPLIKYLLDSYGLDGTFYILGGIVFHVSVAGMLFRPPQFYIPRYLMRQKLLRLKTTTIQPQPGNVIDIAEDIKMNVTAEIMSSSDATGSVMRRSCKRGECDTIVTPDVSVIVDSTSTQRGENYTMYTMSTTISAHENWNEEGVPISDNIALSVINTSTNDGANETETSPHVCSESSEKDTYDWKVLKNPLLYIYVLSLSLSDSSFANVFMMVPPHATDIGISKFKAVFLVSVMGITEGISRLLTGCIADFNMIAKKHIYKASIALCGGLFFVFPLVKQYLHMAVVCGFCGLFSGSFVVLAPVLLAEELGRANIPVTYGVMYSTLGFFYLASPVFMSLLRDLSGNWDMSFFVMGALVVFASITTLIEPWASKIKTQTQAAGISLM